MCALFLPGTLLAQPFDDADPEITHLYIDGNRSLSTKYILSQMTTRATSSFAWFPGVSERYLDLAELQTDMLRIVSTYRDTGYLAAAVDTVIDRTSPGEVTVTLLIREGEPTFVSAVTVTGLDSTDLVDAKDIETRIAVGDRLVRSTIEGDRNRILGVLRNAGYAFATVSASSEVDAEAHTARVIFRSEPGRRYRFGVPIVRGGERVGGTTVRRGLRFKPGQVFSSNVIRESRRQLYLSGAFRSVTIDVPDSLARADTATVVVNVVEREPRTVRVGAAYDTENLFQGEVEWSHRNFSGGARNLRVRASGSALEREFSVNLRQPYVGSSRNWLSGGMEVFDKTVADSLEQSGVEATVAFERNIRLRSTLLFVVGGGLLDFDPDSAFTEFKATFRNDRRDDVLDPRTGTLTTISATQNGYLLTSNREFLKIEAEGRWYRRLPMNAVLAWRIEGGVIVEIGDSNVPPIERFFAGGLSSVRGWALDELSPRDADGNRIGGLSFFESSVELRLRLTGFLGVVGFVDVGSVDDRFRAIEPDGYEYAAGFGLRYLSPVGPIRFDAGRRMTEVSYPAARWRYHVSLGQAF